MLRKEWPSLLEELVSTGKFQLSQTCGVKEAGLTLIRLYYTDRITVKQAETYEHLNIVGLVGSIE